MNTVVRAVWCLLTLLALNAQPATSLAGSLATDAITTDAGGGAPGVVALVVASAALLAGPLAESPAGLDPASLSLVADFLPAARIDPTLDGHAGLAGITAPRTSRGERFVRRYRGPPSA